MSVTLIIQDEQMKGKWSLSGLLSRLNFCFFSV